MMMRRTTQQQQQPQQQQQQQQQYQPQPRSTKDLSPPERSVLLAAIKAWIASNGESLISQWKNMGFARQIQYSEEVKALCVTQDISIPVYIVKQQFQSSWNTYRSRHGLAERASPQTHQPETLEEVEDEAGEQQQEEEEEEKPPKPRGRKRNQGVLVTEQKKPSTRGGSKKKRRSSS